MNSNNIKIMSPLVGEVESTPDKSFISFRKKTLGEVNFPKSNKYELIEFNRTILSLMCFEWVLKNNYYSFTECQKNSSKLTRRNFNSLCSYVKNVVQTEEDIKAMEIFILLNDWTKIVSVIEKVRKEFNFEELDHDVLLLKIAKNEPSSLPEFNDLNNKYKKIIIEALESQFNIGQFIQGENVAFSLFNLIKLSEEALNFYLVHAILDISGAAGHYVQNGSMIMDEKTYQSITIAIDTIRKLRKHKSCEMAYNYYLNMRGLALNLSTKTKMEKAIVRICCQCRIFNKREAKIVSKVFQNLDKKLKKKLVDYLSKTGVNDIAIVMYYITSVFVNSKLKIGLEKTLNNVLPFLVKIYQMAYDFIREEDIKKNIPIMMLKKIAENVYDDPNNLNNLLIQLKKTGLDIDMEIIKQKKFLCS